MFEADVSPVTHVTPCQIYLGLCVFSTPPFDALFPDVYLSDDIGLEIAVRAGGFMRIPSYNFSRTLLEEPGRGRAPSKAWETCELEPEQVAPVLSSPVA